MSSSELIALASRYVWWQQPQVTLAEPQVLLCQLMQLGTWDDFVTARRVYGDDAFRAALRRAPAGVIDPRSWSFWTQFFGITMPAPTRPLPP